MSDSKRVYATLLDNTPVGICQSDRDGNPTYRLVGAEGQIVWVQGQVEPVRDEQGCSTGFAATLTDITAEKELSTHASRLTRLYATLSQVNSAIIHSRTEQELYERISTIMVEKGGFASATVSIVDWARRKSVLATNAGAWRGEARSQLQELDLDDPEFRNLVSMTLLSGSAMTANDYQNDERIEPGLREIVRRAGVKAASTVLLTRFGEAIGALALSSDEKDFFSDDILALIDEVGRNVSFALENFAREAQREQAEERLAHREEDLRVTLHSIGDAVLATDREGRVTMMNAVAEMLTGWSEAEARGQPVGEVFHIINEETRKPMENPIDIVLRDGVVVGLANHTVLIAKDGRELPIADCGAPIRYSDDEDIQGVVLVFRDQSEEQRMMKALRKSERRYANLVEMLPVGVFEAETDGSAHFLNASMIALADVDTAHAGMEKWVSAIHPEDRDFVLRSSQEAATRRAAFSCKFRYLHRDGAIAWAQAWATPRVGDQGEFLGYAGAMLNISQEQENLYRVEQLSKLYETLSQVNSTIVHCDDERELFREIAQIFVRDGGFTLVPMIEIDPADPDHMAGSKLYFHEDYQRRAEILEAWKRLENVPPLTKAALMSRKCEVSNDYLKLKEAEQSCRAGTIALGVASMAAVPFIRAGQVTAVLVLCSGERNYFTPERIDLLEQVGKDVSYALTSIAQRQQRERAEEALAHNEERLRLGLSVTRTGMYESNYATGRFTMNSLGAELMGLGDQPIDVAHETFFTMLPAEEGEQAAQAHQALLAGVVDNYLSEISRVLPDGSVRWLRNIGAMTSERTAEGRPVRLMGLITDITAVKTLEEKDRLAATVFDNSGEAILIVESDYNIVMVNAVFTRMYGYEAEEVQGTSMEAFRSDRHDEAFYQSLRDTLLKKGWWQGEVWLRRKNGEVFPALVSASIVKDANGVLTHYVFQETDVTMQKAFEERISYLAYRDALTDLPNRALLRDRVEQSIASASRDHSTLALLFLDLDHFKNINDSLGHSAGDLLLKEIAQRLIGAVREMDTVGRLGGDEFLVLLPEADADAAGHVAQKLLEESARTFVSGGHALNVTPSIGIALYPKDGINFDELLQTADTAMYRAKDEGRNAYRFYTPEMNQAVFQRMVLESSLRHAIDNHEFVLYYQPKFELAGKTLVGVEALIRWHQPEMGMISPAQFIPVAEESGLIEQIGQWVLEEACRQASIWREQCAPDICIAINFSARQFAARNVAGLITAALADAGVPGSALEIEITESLLARDMEHTLETLQALKKIGVRAAVDDFGTGYSSLSYLKRFPIERLKIDQSFVRDLVIDADDRAIATAVVTMGHALGLRVIAEGVETSQQMDILSNMGCDEVQGYLLGRPINAAEMTKLLTKFAAMPSRAA
ncbi:MAG: EAL domain-containing protein [Georgfuchsia sp.]